MNAAATLADRLPLYLDLIRWDRPAGWLLLLWPTLSALWIAADGFPGWHLLAVFTCRHGADAQRRLLHQRRGRPRVRPPRQAHRAAPGDQRRGERARGAGSWARAGASWPSCWC
jgi:hypothetical protein